MVVRVAEGPAKRAGKGEEKMEGGGNFTGEGSKAGALEGDKKSKEGLLEPVLTRGGRKQGMDSSGIYNVTNQHDRPGAWQRGRH